MFNPLSRLFVGAHPPSRHTQEFDGTKLPGQDMLHQRWAEMFRQASRVLRRFCWLLLANGLVAGAALAQSADLVVNHADSPDPGPAGGIFTYTLRIDNNGPNGAVGVTLTDT